MSFDPAYDLHRTRPPTVARRTPSVGVSLAFTIVPVVVIVVASYPVVTAAAVTGLLVGLTWNDLTDRYR